MGLRADGCADGSGGGGGAVGDVVVFMAFGSPEACVASIGLCGDVCVMNVSARFAIIGFGGSGENGGSSGALAGLRADGCADGGGGCGGAVGDVVVLMAVGSSEACVASIGLCGDVCAVKVSMGFVMICFGGGGGSGGSVGLSAGLTTAGPAGAGRFASLDLAGGGGGAAAAVGCVLVCMAVGLSGECVASAGLWGGVCVEKASVKFVIVGLGCDGGGVSLA